jgi:hypothetical protein
MEFISMSETPYDPPPPTLRLCEACGGDNCIWCTDGYQTLAQRQAWQEFRYQVKSQSGLHTILQELVEEVITKLEVIDNDKYTEMINNGKKILSKWVYADPNDTGYELLTRQLSEFSKEALEVISNIKRID